MTGDPRNIQPAVQQPGPSLQEMIMADAVAQAQQGQARIPGAFTAQMMDKLFSCGLPSEHSDFEDYQQMILCCINLLPRIPNYGAETYRNLLRDFEDIVDEAHSEGLQRQCASDMCKMILNLRALVPRGDFPLQGLTGVSALVTVRQDQTTAVKMPQQTKDGGGIFGFLKR